MADKNAEERIKALQAQLDAALAANVEKQRIIEEAKAGKVISEPVSGTFSVEHKDAVTGKVTKKTYKFKNGRKNVFLEKKMNSHAPSEMVMKLYNGQKLTAKELAAQPILKDYTQEQAVALLTRYANMKAGFLEEV